jgi:putative hemolysin
MDLISCRAGCRRIEFAQLLKVPLPVSRQYQTIAGFLLLQFGTIPNVGEQVDAHGWRFEIVDLDGRRIDKVLATPISEPE